MDFKSLTRDLIAVIIVLSAVATLFFPAVSGGSMELVRGLAGVVVGFYFGTALATPLGASLKNVFKKKKKTRK